MIHEFTISLDGPEFQLTLENTIQATNAIIREEYPESDMIVLRKYEATRVDECLKFCQTDTRRVFGVIFRGFPVKEKLADLPYRHGCYNGQIFGCDAHYEAIADKFDHAVQRRSKVLAKKKAQYGGFLEACRCVEDVEAVIPISEQMRQSIGAPSRALAALNPDIIHGIRTDFSHTREIAALIMQ
jgi:hypothetical protein